MGLDIAPSHLQVLVDSRDGYSLTFSKGLGFQIRTSLIPGSSEGTLPENVRDTDNPAMRPARHRASPGYSRC